MKKSKKDRQDPEGYDTVVTYLGDGSYGCRVLRDGNVISEGVAFKKRDISNTLRDLLRWVDKLGSTSTMASASRDREVNKTRYED
jgi:hypothetical protein